MKKILILHLLLLVASARAQEVTPASVLTSHNNGVCVDAGVPMGAACTDAAVLAAYCAGKAPCADDRPADAKVYSTAIAFRDAVILPDRYAEVFARKRGKVIERLNQLVLVPARCVEIMTAAKLDVSVCR